MYDKMAEDADWKDGISAFRTHTIDQLSKIIEVLDILNTEIKSIKQEIKGDSK